MWVVLYAVAINSFSSNLQSLHINQYTNFYNIHKTHSNFLLKRFSLKNKHTKGLVYISVENKVQHKPNFEWIKLQVKLTKLNLNDSYLPCGLIMYERAAHEHTSKRTRGSTRSFISIPAWAPKQPVTTRANSNCDSLWEFWTARALWCEWIHK